MWAAKIARRIVPREVRASSVARLRSWRKERRLGRNPEGQEAADYLRAHSFRHAAGYTRQSMLARRAVGKRWGQVVAGGPFAGMRYIKEAFCSAYSPKILGCYEAELHPALQVLVDRAPRLILNIGAAEGYYAVGLALLLPDSTVRAYEIDAGARELCSGLARINCAENVSIHAECTHQELDDLPLKGAFILCDCEGCELDLLRPDIVPSLLDCDLLVELHSCFDSRITPEIRQRFEETHDITIISSAARDADSVATAAFLTPVQRQIAVDDGRGDWLQWALMTVKQ